MGMRYKFDVLDALKEKGWNTGRLRAENKENIASGVKGGGISEASIQALREKRPISWANMEKICKKLQCQPGDFLEYVEDEKD